MTYTTRLLALLSITFLMSGGAFAEVFPDKEGFDSYGGYLSIKGKATGRFHLETVNGRHFLVTPEGHGYLALGVCHTGEFKRSREYFEEKCGGDLEIANSELIAHFRDWGYNCLGYGGHKITRERLPYFADCFPTKSSSWRGKQVEFPDVFSDAWKTKARQQIEWMVQQFDVDNPNLIGIYWDDITAWHLKQAKRTAGRTWVDAIRALPADAPGKMRYEQFLRENGADASDEKFQVLIAREIYSTLGPITRELAPGTLIFGERYAGWGMPWEVIQEALPWIDVVSVQPGGSEFPAAMFDRLHHETGKPVMICDHNISFTTPEHSNVMWSSEPDAAGAGRLLGAYMDKAFSTSYMLGYSKCQYIDRMTGGQLKQGLIQADGTPYEEFVDWVRKNNWRIHERFLTKSEAQGAPVPEAGHNDWYWESGANLFVANHNVVEKQYSVEQLSELLSEFPAVTAVYYLAHNNEGLTVHHPSTLLPNPKGWDMTGAWKQACDNSGKRFCVYVNSLGLRLNDNNANPGWVRRKADGQPYTSNGHWAVGTRMCVKSSPDGNGFLEAYFLPLIKEIVSRYEPDGIWVDGDWTIRDNICWCGNCKKAWELKAGKTAVPTNPNDPDWSAWQSLHYERCDEYLKTVADTVHSIHPDCVYTTNNGWRINTDDPRSAPVYAGTLSKDISLWNAIGKTRTLSMKLSSEEQTPHDIMHAINVADKISLPRILQEGGLTIAAGSTWHLWVNRVSPDNDFALKRLRICSEFVQARNAAMGRSNSRNPIAVLASETSSQRQKVEGKSNCFNPKSVDNAALALQDARFGVDVINEHILLSSGQDYRVVVIPSNQQEVLPQTVDFLKAFVEAGGKLLVMGSGMQHGQGRAQDIETLLGLKRTGIAGGAHSLDINGKTASFNYAMNIEIGDAELLASCTNNRAFLTQRRFGKGVAAYVSAAAPIPYPDDSGLLSWAMKILGVTPWVQVQSGDDDKHLVYSFRSKPGRLLLHVVNVTSHVDGKRVEPDVSQDIDPVAVIPELTLKLKLPARPEAVSLLPATGRVEYDWNDGALDLRITNVDYHAVVEMAIDGY